MTTAKSSVIGFFMIWFLTMEVALLSWLVVLPGMESDINEHTTTICQEVQP